MQFPGIPAIAVACSLLAGSAAAADYDVLIRNGTIYDGSGAAPVVGDVALSGDTIVAVGELEGASAGLEIDARGLAVAPGFINVMSWSNESLIADGRSQSEIRQGVTLEVLGEGFSMGPFSPAMRAALPGQMQTTIRYPIVWNTLGGYLEFLAARGIAPNVASFVGATTVRVNVLGLEDRAPDAAELERMRALVREAMAEGALGLSTLLAYPPGVFAATAEIVELARVAAQYGGSYYTHMRNEEGRLLEAIDEAILIAREAGLPLEIFHLKAAGPQNWDQLEAALAKIEQARTGGLPVSADLYVYSATGGPLASLIPAWVQAGGFAAMAERLQDPAVRRQVLEEMRSGRSSANWSNRWAGMNGTEVMPVEFRSEALRKYAGRTLLEIATERGTTIHEVVLDLVSEDQTAIPMVAFVISEDNVRKTMARPWVSFCSDGASMAPEGVFLQQMEHPRAYGAFARVLARYVREEKVLTLQEAIRRMTSLPAGNLKLQRRGRLASGYYADLAIFDPAKIQDHATYTNPHQYATGMVHVFVNGVQVLANGEHTGALPGRVVRGPGWQPKANRT
jgi:N-acyl-D-amino-acid deacylase